MQCGRDEFGKIMFLWNISNILSFDALFANTFYIHYADKLHELKFNAANVKIISFCYILATIISLEKKNYMKACPLLKF